MKCVHVVCLVILNDGGEVVQAVIVSPHQCFCEQLCPVLCWELERLRLLAAAFAECEVELCSLTFSYWTDATDVSIRPLTNTDNNTRDKYIGKVTS